MLSEADKILNKALEWVEANTDIHNDVNVLRRLTVQSFERAKKQK